MEQRKTPTGALWALLASLIFSVNDTLIKFLSDGYALHQIVFTRSLTGVLLLVIVIIPFSGGYGALRTQRLGLHLVRALFVVAANLFFYMALADLPLAIVVAIFFIAPFLITIFSVIFLGETVGKWRWLAVVVGLIGVLLIVRPGTDAFTLTSILPALAALCYASFHILTRKIGQTETLMSLTFYTFAGVFGCDHGDRLDPWAGRLCRRWAPLSRIFAACLAVAQLGGFISHGIYWHRGHRWRCGN